jgi:hypothetical protein
VEGAPDDTAVVARVRAALAAAPGARDAIVALLDRAERDGRLPRTFTIAADGAAAAALREVLSARAVRAQVGGRVRLDLAAVPVPDLAAVLYAALDRAPRDPRGDRERRRADLVAALAAVSAPRHDVARAFLAAERADAEAGRGETAALAERGELARAVAVVVDVARALDALLALDAPIRVASFAARVLGDSKALAAGSDRARRLGAALLAHDPATQADVAVGQPSSYDAAVRAALDARGLVRDDAGVLVHVFGPLVYARTGAAPFDHVARHARLGDPSPLTAAQLRDAALVELPARRVTIFENQAPFLDYVERADPATELVVLARGQASWAAVLLLRLCRRVGVPIRHAGDLDRSGVLILRSLARRARVSVEPWHMDVATHRRFAVAGRPIGPEERARLERLVAVDDPGAPCHELLVELATTGVWIEQEVFSHLLLGPGLDSTTHSDAG